MTTPLGTFFTALGYAVGVLVLCLVARRRGLATEGVAYIAVAGLCGGVLGAKVTQWVLGQGHLAAAHPDAFFNPAAGGRTIIGGILAGWAAVEIAKRRLGLRRSTGDLFALALPAGEAIGRIGCFFNGCCYGTVCGLPWAVYQHGAWRHPAQLYASVAAACTFFLLLRLRDHMPREGDLFRLYLFLYGVSRFTIEIFRERTIGFGGFSMAQWVSIEMVLIGALTLILSQRRVSSGRVNRLNLMAAR